MQLKNSDIFSHIANIGYMPRWLVLLMDLILVSFAFYIAYAVSMSLYYGYGIPVNMKLDFLVLFVSQFFWFWIFHTYSGILRYSTFVDVIKILCAVGANAVTLFVVHYIALYGFHEIVFLRISILVYTFLAFCFLFVLRLFVKTFYDTFVVASGKKLRAVVYGTKAAGVSIAKMIKSNNESRYLLVGFLDDDEAKYDKMIFGRQIFSMQTPDLTFERLRRKKVKVIIMSPFKMRSVNVDMLNLFVENGFKVLTVPTMEQWHEGDSLEHVDIERNIRNIQIEDLLNRKPISVDKEHVSAQLTGKVVMVSGAAGSIGSEIARQVASYKPHLLILLDNAETPLHNLRLELNEKFPDTPLAFCIADVRNRERIDNVFSEMHPEYVYHAAAYKHVPLMEEFPSECILANVMGTKNMADCAVKYGVSSFVMVSTDKAVNPTNVMGASKRISEIYVQSYFKSIVKENETCTRFITTRFGNVLGSNGSVIPLFKKQIEAGGPVTVTDPNIIRYFMTIPEACELVLEAGTMGKGGEIFIFDMGQPVKIADLARKMIRLAGLVPDKDIMIKYTGLRPGEKLYEELLNVKELTQPTYHEKIMIASVREYEYADVSRNVDELISLAKLYKDYLVVKKMKEIVPEYVSQNSQYEQLDINR